MEKPDELELKTISGKVDADLYWKFKAAAAERHETIPQALENAVRLYVSIKTEQEQEQ